MGARMRPSSHELRDALEQTRRLMEGTSTLPTPYEQQERYAYALGYLMGRIEDYLERHQ